MTTHIAFTGTRNGLSTPQRVALTETLGLLSDPSSIMHNGACAGADHSAATIWRDLSCRLEFHPGDRSQAQWAQGFCVEGETVRPCAPYLLRNHHMVDASSVLVGCPSTMEETLRSGTWATIRYARRMKVYRVLVLPNGRIVEGLDV